MTNKNVQDKIVDKVESTLKKNYIKALIQGYTILANSIVEMIDDGSSVDDIRKFCSNPRGAATLLKVASKKKNRKEK